MNQPNFPVCPSCGSDKKRCVRPSGHEILEWHVEREDIAARDCMCADVCIPWLTKRGQLAVAQ